MPRALSALTLLALAFAGLLACDQSTHFRPVAVDGLPRCAPPAQYYARPLCLEIDGDDTRSRQVVSDADLRVHLPDRGGEWTFRLGHCEHPRDFARPRYECGECLDTHATVRRVGPGPGRRVTLPAPRTIECIPPSD